jgi:CMP-N,N'-diacetyllegionaminic acid synthase
MIPNTEKSILCLMLARGGSKGVPGKNIKLLNGKPLIYYTIKAVQKAGIYDRFMLSTDDPQIAEVARGYDVDVPFIRPTSLAGDTASAVDAIEHALKWLEAQGETYDYVQYIFPTAPLRTCEDLLGGLDTLVSSDADMVISVCKTDHPAQWMNVLPPDNSLQDFVKKEYRQKNNQTLPATYRINGSIYVGKWEIFYNKLDWLEQDTVAHIMPRKRSIDIDLPLDFKLAEVIMKEKCNE